MSWIWLKAVPWSTIIANAPTIVDGARKLLDRRGGPQQYLAGGDATPPTPLRGGGFEPPEPDPQEQEEVTP